MTKFVLVVIIGMLILTTACGGANSPSATQSSSATPITEATTTNVTGSPPRITTPISIIPPPTKPETTTATSKPPTTATTATKPGVWLESWTKARSGSYSSRPQANLEANKRKDSQALLEAQVYIEGDLGSWQVTDTISLGTMIPEKEGDPVLPEMSPQIASIVDSSDGKLLEMQTANTQKFMDDLWVVMLFDINDRIPLKETTTLSFKASGELPEMVPVDDSDTTSNFGFIGLVIGGICYTIYETGSFSAEKKEKMNTGFGRKIHLGKSDLYTRNIFDDYTKYLGNKYTGNETIDEIILLIRGSSGWATFDEIYISSD